MGSSCPCDTGYFNSGTLKICQLCHHSCLTCSLGNSINKCDTCPSPNMTFNRDDKALTIIGGDGTCPCTAKYYDDNTSQDCKSCHYSCTTCLSFGES